MFTPDAATENRAAELAGLTIRGGYEGPGHSPDRADACVWALTELMLGPQRAPPRLTLLWKGGTAGRGWLRRGNNGKVEPFNQRPLGRDERGP